MLLGGWLAVCSDCQLFISSSDEHPSSAANGTDAGRDVAPRPNEGLPCGATRCGASEVCCVDFNGSASCSEPAACDFSHAYPLACVSSESCDAGDVCCAEWDMGLSRLRSVAKCVHPGSCSESSGLRLCNFLITSESQDECVTNPLPGRAGETCKPLDDFQGFEKYGECSP